jgi:hypothetical protein
MRVYFIKLHQRFGTYRFACNLGVRNESETQKPYNQKYQTTLMYAPIQINSLGRFKSLKDLCNHATTRSTDFLSVAKSAQYRYR